MSNGKVTDTKIRGLKPGPKPVKHPDGGGLYLVVNPAGNKLWRIDYRYEGKRQTLSLGAWPVVNLAEARAKLLTAKKELKAGLNPTAEKQAQKRSKQAETLTCEKAALAFLESRRESGYDVGAPWRDLPPNFGGWGNTHRRFIRWRDKGVWERLLETLIDEPDY